MDPVNIQEELLRLHRVNSPKNSSIPNHEPTRCSFKNNGIVRAYAANTNQGIYRKYNEDRVSIILNIGKPVHKQKENMKWPSINYFGVFDGHGGHNCADYLRDNLHNFIINDKEFPKDIEKSIQNGFRECEKGFIQQAISGEQLDKSGSCANVCLLVDSICYIANVGDSRAILSRQKGSVFHNLSIDHKPDTYGESSRISQNGGKVYQTEIDGVLGPKRVFPGRLSVSRAFGDVDAKLEQFGGKQGVVTAEPEISIINVNPNKDDFILIGCDGIFDHLSTQTIIEDVWKLDYKNYSQKDTNLHQISGDIVEKVIQMAIQVKSTDNLTVVAIVFPNFQRHVQEITDKQKKESTGHEHYLKSIENIHKSQQIMSQRTNNINQKSQNINLSKTNSSTNSVFKLNTIRNLSINENNLINNQEQPKIVKSTKSSYNTSKIVFKRRESSQDRNSLQKMINNYSQNKQMIKTKQQNQMNKENKENNIKFNRTSYELKNDDYQSQQTRNRKNALFYQLDNNNLRSLNEIRQKNKRMM